MAHPWPRLLLVLPIAWLVLSVDAAQADQIDGHWCYQDGSSFTIRGPQIVTPAGNLLRGEYNRHGFAYVVPEGEKGAGDKVLMAQQNHSTVHVWRGGRTAAERSASEVWHRCDPYTS